MKRSAIYLFVFVLFVFIGLEANAQCAMCKASMESSGGGAGADVHSYGLGINDGIMYLMLTPYLLLFLFFRKKIFGFLKEFRAMWSR